MGHILAIFSVVVWGGTFSSTKALLDSFSPAEILFIRFFVAYIFLSLLCRSYIGFSGFKNEWLFILAGGSGGCLYFLAENIALTYTTASNAALLVAINPLFTGLLCYLLYSKRLNIYFGVGFTLACVGIVLVVFRGDFSFEVYPLGDMLCIIAGLIWSCYTLLVGKISAYFSHTSSLAILKRIFFYAWLWSLPFALYSSPLLEEDLSVFYGRFFEWSNCINLIFLSLVASGLCYLAWNVSVKHLGELKASTYIYGVPVVGVGVACVALGEEINMYILIGGLLTLLGLFISQK